MQMYKKGELVSINLKDRNEVLAIQNHATAHSHMEDCIYGLVLGSNDNFIFVHLATSMSLYHSRIRPTQGICKVGVRWESISSIVSLSERRKDDSWKSWEEYHSEELGLLE